MLRTKSSMNKKRAITQNLGKQELRFMCTAHTPPPPPPPPLLMRSIHPQNFITIAFIVLEICTRQNLSIKKKKKGNNSKTKQARVTVHVHCTPS